MSDKYASLLTHFRHSLRIDLGSSLTYEPCDCQGKYAFKPNSPLLPYLRQCEGWVEDIEGKYTLNYIIIVLLAFAKEKKLIKKRQHHLGHYNIYLKFNPELKQALDLDHLKGIYIRELRMFVSSHLQDHRVNGIFTLSPPFSCVNKLGKRSRKVIASIFGKKYKKAERFEFISSRCWHEAKRLRKAQDKDLKTTLCTTM